LLPEQEAVAQVRDVGRYHRRNLHIRYPNRRRRSSAPLLPPISVSLSGLHSSCRRKLA
jgi:hypothetical protein